MIMANDDDVRGIKSSSTEKVEGQDGEGKIRDESTAETTKTNQRFLHFSDKK